ncbi:glycosyltransferase [Methanobrevibacter filiformis]|uniref:Alpha-monoglucosyldiacylglycerol synthase n=1 Tax=Methanobrevibacter filiformis TaxID=55758 RepID=A0A166DLZ8_9EURY|nr:glycosyltransferase [Methanobrevibacter filiformis]KZX15739.1 alpha-monoglucosyldiacylglycerol synthase [Methanobrevibacter filiformis]
MINVNLVSRFFDARNGGVGAVSAMVLKSLKNNKEININTLSQADSILYKNGPIGKLGHLDYLFYSLIEIPFKIKEADVYHAISPIEALWLNKDKTVVTIHDLLLTKMPEMIHSGILSKPFGIYYTITMKKAIKSKEIIAISQETANELNDYCGIDYSNINIVRDPIRDDLYTKTSLKNDIYTIGTVSLLNKRKRVDILIKNFLKADMKNSQLLIAGTGNQDQYLKEIAKGDKRVKFLGFVPDEDLNDFYNSLDLFVYPSIMEGYGLPIVEAMACSLPVITLEDAFIPNDLKKRTFLSSKNNLAEDLKKRTFNIDIDSNLKFVNEHSQEKISKQLIELYKKVAEK